MSIIARYEARIQKRIRYWYTDIDNNLIKSHSSMKSYVFCWCQTSTCVSDTKTCLIQGVSVFHSLIEISNDNKNMLGLENCWNISWTPKIVVVFVKHFKSFLQKIKLESTQNNSVRYKIWAESRTKSLSLRRSAALLQWCNSSFLPRRP